MKVTVYFHVNRTRNKNVNMTPLVNMVNITFPDDVIMTSLIANLHLPQHCDLDVQTRCCHLHRVYILESHMSVDNINYNTA